MPVGTQARIEYYRVDCKNARVTGRQTGDYFEGQISAIKIEKGQFDGDDTYTVKVLFRDQNTAECLSFNMQTTFGRMVVARLTTAVRAGTVKRGTLVRFTPYMHDRVCCGAIRVEGDKIASTVSLPKPTEIKAGARTVLDDTEVISFMHDCVSEISEALSNKTVSNEEA